VPVACALAIDVSADCRARTTVRFQLIGSFFAGNSELFWDLYHGYNHCNNGAKMSRSSRTHHDFPERHEQAALPAINAAICIISHWMQMQLIVSLDTCSAFLRTW
jgi:hypothetical protein